MRCAELKNLIRSGIPHEHRSKVWKWCVNLHVKKFKDTTVPEYFQTLLQSALEKQNPASKQIELDLLRTLPNNKHYSSPTSEGIQKLRNVLLAFSWRNPDIGYCQGLNRWGFCEPEVISMWWKYSLTMQFQITYIARGCGAAVFFVVSTFIICNILTTNYHIFLFNKTKKEDLDHKICKIRIKESKELELALTDRKCAT